MEQTKHPEYTPAAEMASLRAERDRLREINKELLAALKNAEDYFDRLPKGPDRDHHIGEDLKQIRAAIAKAEKVEDLERSQRGEK